MANKFCVSVTTSLDDPDRATVAFVVANAAVASEKETLVFLLIGLVGALFFDGVLRVIRHHLTGWWAARFEHRAYCSAVRKLMQALRNSPAAQPSDSNVDL